MPEHSVENREPQRNRNWWADGLLFCSIFGVLGFFFIRVVNDAREAASRSTCIGD
jgi:hypothetical protein